MAKDSRRCENLVWQPDGHSQELPTVHIHPSRPCVQRCLAQRTLGQNLPHHYKRLPCSAPTTLASLFSTDIKFIHLHSPRETVSPWPHHSKTQLVQPNPSGPVTAQAQYSLNIKCAYSVFLIRYIPHRAEPQLQRFSRILKNRPCGHRGLKITFPAMIQSPSCLPCLLMATTGANKPVWPAKLEKVLLACLLRGKSVFKFHECSRVIFHTRKYYMLGSLESSA